MWFEPGLARLYISPEALDQKANQLPSSEYLVRVCVLFTLHTSLPPVQLNPSWFVLWDLSPIFSQLAWLGIWHEASLNWIFYFLIISIRLLTSATHNISFPLSFHFYLPRYLCFLLFQSMYHFYLYVVNTFSLSLGIYLFALCLLNYVGISTSIYVYPCLYIYVCTSMTIYLCIFMCISLSMSSSGNSMTCMFTNVFCFSAFRSLSLHLSCVSYFTLFV